MSKKVVLLGLTACEVMAASIATIFVTKANVPARAESETPSNYVAEISKANNLISYGILNSRAFRLHGGDEYGYFYMSATAVENGWFDPSPSGDYSDYAFSWTNKNGNSYFFEILLYDNGTSNRERINGEYHYLRGFPGAYRITTVYSLSSSPLNFDPCRPNSSWDCTKTIEGNLITEVATKKPDSASDNYMNWCLREEGTVYIKSITIEYTC